MKKEKIKNIVLIIVVAVISSTITSFATSNYLFDSIDVKYNNSNGVQAETVQGAIDELYSCASDYSSVNNRIDNLVSNYMALGENDHAGLKTIGSNGVGYVTQIQKNGDFTLWKTENNGKNWISTGGFGNSSDGMTFISNDINGGYGLGKLNIIGNPVMINGKDAAIKYGIDCSSYPNSSDDLLRCIRNQISSFPHETPFLILASFYGNRYGIGYVYNGDAYANFTIFNFDGLTVNIRNINGTWSYKYINDYSNYTTVN